MAKLYFDNLFKGVFYCLSGIIGGGLFWKIFRKLQQDNLKATEHRQSRKTIFHPTATTNAYRRSVMQNNDRRGSLASTINQY